MNLYEPLMNLKNDKQLETKKIMNLMNLDPPYSEILAGEYTRDEKRFIRFRGSLSESLHRHGQLTALYPSDSRSETASVTSVSIPGNVRLEPSRPGLTKTDHCQVRGSLREPERYRRYCPNPNPIVREGRGVPEPEGRVRTLLIKW